LDLRLDLESVEELFQIGLLTNQSQVKPDGSDDLSDYISFQSYIEKYGLEEEFIGKSLDLSSSSREMLKNAAGGKSPSAPGASASPSAAGAAAASLRSASSPSSSASPAALLKRVFLLTPDAGDPVTYTYLGEAGGGAAAGSTAGEPGGASVSSSLTLDTLDPLLCARLSLAPDSPALRATRPSPGAPAPSQSQSASFAYLMGCYARAKDDARRSGLDAAAKALLASASEIAAR
jgi:hypothetical protein